MKKIFNYKHYIILLLLLIVTFSMIFYIPVSGAISAYKQKDDIRANYDLPEQERESNKNKNLLDFFNDQRKNIHLGLTYIDFIGAKYRIIPIILVLGIFIFANYKKRLLKYNIGRSNEYRSEKRKLKRKIALIAPIFALIVFVTITIISITLATSYDNTVFRVLYDQNDIIGAVIYRHEVAVIIWELFSFIAIFMLSLFSLELADRYGKVDSLIILAILLVILPILLNGGLNYQADISYITPDKNLIYGSSNSMGLRGLVSPIIPVLVGIIWIRRLDSSKEEIE